MTRPTGQLLRVGNVELWVESWVPEATPAPATDPAPACLLVGGAGAIGPFWPDRFCEGLAAAGFRTIRYDHRDTGRSTFVDFARTPYTLPDLVQDALGVLDGLGVARAHVVGHSMGGFLAQLAAIEYPERVASFASASSHTASPAVPAPSPEVWEVMLANQPVGDIERGLPGFLNVWRYLNGDRPFDKAAAAAYTRELYARNPATLPATNHVASQATMQDRTAALGLLDTPCLVLHGERDPLVPPEGGRLTADAVPGARYVELADAGHMFFDEELWDTILTELVAFLRSVSDQKGASGGMNWVLRQKRGSAADDLAVHVPEDFHGSLLDILASEDALLGLDPYRDRRIDPRELPRAIAAVRRVHFYSDCALFVRSGGRLDPDTASRDGIGWVDRTHTAAPGRPPRFHRRPEFYEAFVASIKELDMSSGIAELLTASLDHTHPGAARSGAGQPGAPTASRKRSGGKKGRSARPGGGKPAPSYWVTLPLPELNLMD